MTTTKSSLQTSGWAAVISALFGISRIGFLIGYLVIRSSNLEVSILLNRMHDLAVAIQFLLLIPVTTAFQKLSLRQQFPLTQMSQTIVVVTLCLVTIFALLTLPKIVSDILYMLPQGVFGVWLIFFCLNMNETLSKSVRRFGVVVGFGLTLVGLFFLGYVILVSPIPLRIPAASLEEAADIPITTANSYLHYFLDVGSLLGVLLLPVWTSLIGRKLFLEKIN